MKQALAFMVQTRSDANVKGDNSIAWRDSPQFSFELNGLVLQYMANPSVYDNMPQTIFAEGTYVGTNKLTGTEYEDLKTQNEPDIIWLIKFAGAGAITTGLHAGQKAAHADKGAAGPLSLSRAGADRARQQPVGHRKAVCLADLSSYTFIRAATRLIKNTGRARRMRLQMDRIRVRHRRTSRAIRRGCKP